MTNELLQQAAVHRLWKDFALHLRERTDSMELLPGEGHVWDRPWWWAEWQCFLAGAKAENNRILEAT